MKIVEVTPVLGPGGAERLVVDLCNQLVINHEVYLIVLYPIDNSQPIVEEIDSRVKLLSVNKKRGLDYKAFSGLCYTIKKINPDVIHSHLYAITYLFPLFLTNKHIVFLHTIHSHAAIEAENGFKRWLRKYAFSSHKVFPVTISEESKLSFTEFYGLDSKLIYNGRPQLFIDNQTIEQTKEDISEKRVSPTSLVLVNVARVVDVKNQVSLAEAIDSLYEEGFDIELFIIGDIKDKGMEKSIQQLNNPRIHLMGTCKSPRPYMKLADAFILSSKMEGMPITLIEAFSVGAIPICTSVGGIKNMINDGINGILIDSPKKEDIKKAVVRFSKLSRIQKDEMARNSMTSFKNYDIISCANNYESYMKELLTK